MLDALDAYENSNDSVVTNKNTQVATSYSSAKVENTQVANSSHYPLRPKS